MTAREIEALQLGDKTIKNRLFVGTGKYDNFSVMNDALEASETEVVTVAVRRLDLNAPPDEQLMNYLDANRYHLLPNTAACFSAEDAIRVARLGKELGMGNWVKLEVLGDQDTLLPDPIETLKATRQLVAEGFDVLVYTSDDPIMAMRLEDEGVVAVMPAGAPIGSGQGILNENNISIIIEKIKVPVIVDAGVGTASDVSKAMELGADGVLLNTGIAGAKDPVNMAVAMGLACKAGYFAHRAGRIAKKRYATASSPMKGLPGE